MIKQRLEIKFQFKRTNGVGDRKTVEIILPQDVVNKLRGQEKGLPVLIPYLYPFIKEGEEITWYTYRILVQDVDAENKKEQETKRVSKKKNIPEKETNSNVSNDNLKAKKEQIDLEFYRKQKKNEFQKNRKQEKITNAKNYYAKGGNKFIYFLKRFWIFLDKPWKKIVFSFLLVIGFIFINDLFSLSTDKKELENANVKFEEIYNQAQIEITNKNFEKVTLLEEELENLIKNTKISNEFLSEKKREYKKNWKLKVEEINNILKTNTNE